MYNVKPLPVDITTWKMMNYDPLYYVANSAIKFYENRLIELGDNLTDENKEILRESIVKIDNLMFS